MKILGGQFKGRNFYMPAEISPTQNLVRKAVFDILGDISGLDFLELFAGSGAVGLEAFSRGARTVTVVERDISCVDVINENLKLLGISSSVSPGPFVILPADVFVAIKQLAFKKKKYDVVFIDPPFEKGLGKKALKALGACDILRPNCFLLIQGGKNEILPLSEGRFQLVRKKEYGASHLSVYEGKAS